jgi:lipoprotein-releasing system permease protein
VDFSLYIAKRYLVSKKSNNAINIISWISVTAIAITTAALVVILSAMNGLTGTVAGLYNALEPDIKITAKKGKGFLADEKMMQQIKNLKGVKIVCQTLSDQALIKNVDKQVLVSVIGVDDNFNKITKIESCIIDGNYGLGKDQKRKVLMGQGIAAQIQVNIKEYVNELSLYSPIKGKGGSLIADENFNQVYVTPSGIFTLNDELDFQNVFVSLETARKLFDEPEKISALQLQCEKGKEDEVKEELQNLYGNDFNVKNRYELNDVLFKTMETEKLATLLILGFIMIIATFNIIGALTMLIIEKKKDIKTLYSMGASQTLIRNIFMREGFLITSIGTAMGLLLGLLVCWLQIEFHLVEFGEGVIPYWPIELQLKDFISIFGLIMLIGFFAALYPVKIFTKADLVH